MIQVASDFKWADLFFDCKGNRGETFQAPLRQSAEISLSLYKAFVKPHLEYCSKKDKDCLEKAQRLAARMSESQSQRSCEQRLSDLGLFSWEHSVSRRSDLDVQDS